MQLVSMHAVRAITSYVHSYALKFSSIKIPEPATITDPSEQIVMDREQLVGTGSVTYVYEAGGFPAPSVTWYFNGGDSVNGNELVIGVPQPDNSGIYQCLVRNTIEGTVHEVWRAWTLEVREPGKSLKL